MHRQFKTDMPQHIDEIANTSKSGPLGLATCFRLAHLAFGGSFLKLSRPFFAKFSIHALDHALAGPFL